MVIFGVLLIIVAVIAGVLLFMGTGSLTDTVDFEILGGTLSLPPVALLVTGMVVITVFWFGWFLLRVGTTRAHRRRAAAKEAAREAEEQRLADEARLKEELAARDRELAEERARHEQREAELRREADERVADQHVSTETARRRAEVAEARAGERRPGTAEPAADPAAPADPPGERTS
ncbi:hypothetical protein [uncultured Phycicoccus sp.]|uniref:hypothetical protein n=1 Tax=uncultured Phycicoccus sp. TaxID=661422 RepID=UPI002625CEEE|nr:hypothetical protein [uncultured Phycicoccus sp.]